jgi:uncharacterized damage-inducible protein DinB
MSSAEWFLHLARNNAFANERLYTACGALTHDELVAPRTSFFPTILGTLAHIVIVDVFYVDGLVGGGRGKSVWDDEPRLDRFDVVRAEQRKVDAQLLDFCRTLDDAALARAVGLERANGIKLDRAGDILLHLFLHQVHHRGQVHAMLSGTRIAPPQLDEYFLAEDRVVADRELAAAFSQRRTPGAR